MLENKYGHMYYKNLGYKNAYRPHGLLSLKRVNFKFFKNVQLHYVF